MRRKLSVFAALLVMMGVVQEVRAQNVTGHYVFAGNTTSATGPQAPDVPLAWGGEEDLEQATGSTDIMGTGTLTGQTVSETGYLLGGVVHLWISWRLGATPATIELQGTLSSEGTISGTMSGRTYDGAMTWTGTFLKAPPLRECKPEREWTQCLCVRKESPEKKFSPLETGVLRVFVPLHLVGSHVVSAKIVNTDVIGFGAGRGAKWGPVILDCDLGSVDVTYQPVAPGTTLILLRIDDDVEQLHVGVVGLEPKASWTHSPNVKRTPLKLSNGTIVGDYEVDLHDRGGDPDFEVKGPVGSMVLTLNEGPLDFMKFTGSFDMTCSFGVDFSPSSDPLCQKQVNGARVDFYSTQLTNVSGGFRSDNKVAYIKWTAEAQPIPELGVERVPYDPLEVKEPIRLYATWWGPFASVSESTGPAGLSLKDKAFEVGRRYVLKTSFTADFQKQGKGPARCSMRLEDPDINLLIYDCIR